jgi:D-arabinose 1-dehydrogenase-like Zn-dependent alcohol dehydrogenase
MRGRAAVLAKTNQLETWDVAITDPEPGGALVSIVLGGVCGSDVHILTGEAGEMPFPIILGHEGIGRIEKLGAGGATDYAGTPVKPGDLVYWSPIALCRRCYSCTVLDETPCENTRFFEDASKPNWGSYADYAWLPNGMPFFRLPDHAQPEAVAALGCALPTALRGFDRCGPVRVGETVVVQGAGPVGLSAILIAAQAGARLSSSTDRRNGWKPPARSAPPMRSGWTSPPTSAAGASTTGWGHSAPMSWSRRPGCSRPFPRALTCRATMAATSSWGSGGRSAPSRSARAT